MPTGADWNEGYPADIKIFLFLGPRHLISVHGKQGSIF
jgi:hypothetical protein